jgi:hypothetical protein
MYFPWFSSIPRLRSCSSGRKSAKVKWRYYDCRDGKKRAAVEAEQVTRQQQTDVPWYAQVTDEFSGARVIPSLQQLAQGNQ